MERDHILDWAEASITMLPEVPGTLRHLAIPGVEGRITAIPRARANVVSRARLSPANADDVIDQVFASYDGLPFSWVVGPASTPSDLTERLAAKGMREAERVDLMVTEDMDLPVPSSPEVEVREILLSETVQYSRLMVDSFGMAQDGADMMLSAYAASGPKPLFRFYLAHLDGQPVSWAVTALAPDLPLALLAGGATLPAYRGRGAYSTLTAHRLRDLKAGGVEAVIIQAVPATSAPICRRLGFQDVASLTTHFGGVQA